MASTTEMASSNSWVMNFHDVDYTILMTATENKINIEVEQEQSPHDRWCGEFSSGYIEDITAKTGNFKKFSTFLKMLLTALNSSSESVFVDLLTYGDLEALRAKKLGKTSGGNTRGNTKRYLILTYAAEFDRAHYPLPLSYENKPSYEALTTMVHRLRQENTNYKKEIAMPIPDQLKSLEIKCEELKNELLIKNELEDEEKEMISNHIEMRDAYQNLRNDYDGLRTESASEIRRLRNENKVAQQRVIELEAYSARDGGDHQMKGLKLKCSKLEAMLEDEKVAIRRMETRHKREVSSLKISIEREQKTNLELRNKIRELNKMKSSNYQRRNHTPLRSQSPNLANTRRNKSPLPSRGSPAIYDSNGRRTNRSGVANVSPSHRPVSSDSRRARRTSGGGHVSDGYASAGSGYDSHGSANSRTSSRGRGRSSSLYAPTASSSSKQRTRPDSPVANQRRPSPQSRKNVGQSKRQVKSRRSASRDSGYSSNDSNGSNMSRRSITSNNSNRRRLNNKESPNGQERVYKSKNNTQGGPIQKPPIYGRTSQKTPSVPSASLFPPHISNNSNHQGHGNLNNENDISIAPSPGAITSSSLIPQQNSSVTSHDLPLEPPHLLRQLGSGGIVPLRDRSNQSDALELLETTKMTHESVSLSSPQKTDQNTYENENIETNNIVIENTDDTSAEISDIDRRLNQLQEFLRQAKQAN